MIEKLKLGKVKITSPNYLEINIDDGKIYVRAKDMSPEQSEDKSLPILHNYSFEMNGNILDLSNEDKLHIFKHIQKNMDEYDYLLQVNLKNYKLMTSKYTIDEMNEDYKNSLEFKVIVNEMYNIFENNEMYEYMSVLSKIKK